MKIKITKLFLFCLLIIVSFISINSVHSFANTESNDIDSDGTIHLNLLNVKTDYNPEYVKAIREDLINEVKVTIYDKETNTILDIFGESKTLRSARGPYSSVTVYKDLKIGPFTSRLQTMLTVYSSGSFRQINSVNNKAFSAISPGSWVLTDKSINVVSTSGRYPTTSIHVSGTAVIDATTTKSTTGSTSVSNLKALGFSVSSTSSSTIHMRFPISKDYIYSLY